MKKHELKVEKRVVFGKKLNNLRKQGIVPANIYGTDFKSTSVSVNYKDFVKAYKIAKETAVLYLDLDKTEIPVLIKSLQKHPVNDSLLHVDFRKIDLSKKVVTDVPVKTTGVSEAVTQKGGVLLLQSESLTVEALPSDIPQEIMIDISILKEIGGEIKVSDLAKSQKFEYKTPQEKVVVSVVAHKEESITPDTTVAAPEVLTEAAPAEGEVAEGEASAVPGKDDAKATAPAKAAKDGAKAEAPASKK